MHSTPIQLPDLHKNLFNGLFTILKGVKIGDDDIDIKKTFLPVTIDLNNLTSYKKLFGFTDDLPITYLYLLAQRAQVALMLDKKFTISIPGLIHVENNLEKFTLIDASKPIELKASVVVKSEPEGYLKPCFEVFYYQNDVLIARCESQYIAKRKSKNKSKRHKKTKSVEFTSIINEFEISQKQASKYSIISGDRNPIHISSFIAKILGFKSTIIHGWYSVSKIVSLVNSNGVIDKVSCKFLNPIYLNKAICLVDSGNHYQLIDEDRKISFVECTIN